MALRASKAVLVFAIALFYTILVLNRHLKLGVVLYMVFLIRGRVVAFHNVKYYF